MKNKKKELIKNLKILIEDLLDNYEKYTEEEKLRIRDIFETASALNAILYKYDIETEFCRQEYFDSVSKYFGAN